MIADTQIMEKIVGMAQQLSPEYRLRLIQRITETLIPSSVTQEPQPLQYGKYKGNRMSTPEDFTIAEWQPKAKNLPSSSQIKNHYVLRNTRITPNI